MQGLQEKNNVAISCLTNSQSYYYPSLILMLCSVSYSFAGSQCHSNLRDDVLLILISGGILLPEEISHPLWYVNLSHSLSQQSH